MSLNVVTASEFKKKGSAPGKAVLVKTAAGAGQERTTELYHPPGISSTPTPKDRVVSIPIGSGVKVAVATHNYRVEVDQASGETTVYSTSADGETLKATIKLDSDGNIDMNSGSNGAAREGDSVKVTIPAGTFIVSVTGGAGAPAVGVPNPAPIDVTGTITDGSGTVKIGD